MSRARDLADSADKDIVGTLNVDGLDVDGAVDFASTTAHAGDATFADNAKAIFGAGSDLQIYHDGSNSYIKDVGTGNFELSSNGDGFYFRDGSSNYLLTLSNGGAAQLWHNGSAKIATTSTGINVTGTVTSDGLTVTQSGSTTATIGATGTSGDNDGTLIINNGGTGDGMLRFDYESHTDRARIGVSSSSQNLQFYTAGNNERMRISATGSVGIGVVPKSWNSAFNGVLQVGTYGVMAGTSGSAQFGSNFYYDGAYKRINTNFASRTYQENGNHVFETAASGSADSAISFSESMRISASGEISGTSFQENYAALSGTTPSIDADTGGYFSLTTSGNTTFTFAAVTTGRSVGFLLEITAGGAHNLIWPSAAGTSKVFWAGGTAPDAPASGAKNLYVFVTRDSGTNWIGALASAAYA